MLALIVVLVALAILLAWPGIPWDPTLRRVIVVLACVVAVVVTLRFLGLWPSVWAF